MSVATEKCFHCGTRVRPSSLDPGALQPYIGTRNPSLYLNKDGSSPSSNYWFCSIRCFKDEVRKRLDRKYDFDATFTDTPEYKEICKRRERYREEYEETGNPYRLRDAQYEDKQIITSTELWEFAKRSAITNAMIDLGMHIYAEGRHDYQKEMEEADARIQKSYANCDKMIAEDKERTMRNEERKREREERELQKEQDKARKQQDADAIKQAEEERWKPRPFRP